ncbi:E3 ubiquitin-protein ligase RNF8-like isoform X1 [Hylaeus anthracinus]|uniref:E3 ubiquitin-protein ligase RNF8-like isoform X1 n=1 Tax=Hylaeus anthracinus TaxID=313031 RepID=UPI0023B88687|nr:E3 ubiquitin-protein ligase RNF8-like isoform X1 [Hylaeus anthracinus]XP_054003477.1 E3 ubiquitin-protein ligase RNF8-like isoform X1 [Hylaeus anthracinus]
MEGSKVEKRVALDDSDAKPLEPILVRVDKHGTAPKDIYIDKNEFKIGRARENDEIILDTMISRKQCIFRCEGNEEWTIKDVSSSATFVNGVHLTSGVNQRIFNGDVVQFSTSDQFKYVFTLVAKEEQKTKRARLDEQIMDNVLTEQKTFSENQECQKRVLKNQLETKQKEQDVLKKQLEQLLTEQNATKESTEDLKKQITLLEGKIENGNIQEQHLQEIYAELLEKLENERVKFEKRLNNEKQKWQEALNVSKHEKEMLEIKMKEQMEKWREEQQAEWKSVMENRVKTEKTIQAQLLNEKTVLEEKLKETEKALKEQEAKVETIQSNAASSSDNPTNNCIFLEFVNDPTGFQILDTIDLTLSSQLNIDNKEKESVINKVNNIMDEQLTCSICSELFVKATTLNCMHTFCEHCINKWTKKTKVCPMCRAPIGSKIRSIVLDNFIESMLENLPTDMKEKREEIKKERKATKHRKKLC